VSATEVRGLVKPQGALEVVARIDLDGQEGEGFGVIYLSSHAGAIVGMPMPEARILLRDLTEHATQPRFVYVHRWRPWDLVMWDNQQVMHRVRRYDDAQPRDMRRTTMGGGAPTTAQVEAA
jgi:alpha-ketoglutarate-dependent 2,4-dichlorophenoxyacetate dioxygenase